MLTTLSAQTKGMIGGFVFLLLILGAGGYFYYSTNLILSKPTVIPTQYSTNVLDSKEFDDKGIFDHIRDTTLTLPADSQPVIVQYNATELGKTDIANLE